MQTIRVGTLRVKNRLLKRKMTQVPQIKRLAQEAQSPQSFLSTPSLGVRVARKQRRKTSPQRENQKTGEEVRLTPWMCCAMRKAKASGSSNPPQRKSHEKMKTFNGK